MERIVGIGEYVISNEKTDVIKTFALASCVAITVYNPFSKTAGMAHIVLPDDSTSHLLRVQQPCYYATSGIPLLIDKMCTDFGCLKSDLQIELFGGAQSKNINDVFNIGPRNVFAVREVLDSLNLGYVDSQIGGVNSRTLELDVNTGEKTVFSQPLII